MRGSGTSSTYQQRLVRACTAFVPVYAAAVLAYTLLGSESSWLHAFVVDWMALPSQIIALSAASWRAFGWRRVAPAGAGAWTLFAAASALSIVALIVWNVVEPSQAQPWLASGDVIYLASYCALSAALACLFVFLGGTFRSRLVGLEALSIMTSMLAVLWAVMYGPLAPAPSTYQVSYAYAGAYGVVAALLLVLSSAVGSRATEVGARAFPRLLAVAGLVEGIWVIGWLMSWLATEDFLGRFADFGEVLAYSSIAVAAFAAAPRPSPLPHAADEFRSTFTFMPTLLVLVAVALLTSLIAARSATGTWLILALLVFCGSLIVGRHFLVQRTFERMQRAIVEREIDCRVTELVRESADVFVIAGADGVIAFASPAAGNLLPFSAGRLVGKQLPECFGADNAVAIHRLLGDVMRAADVVRAMELTLTPTLASGVRVLRVAATNHLANPNLRGVVLVISDITRERALEREVVEVASAERLRLAAEVHDGIGQELTGIALLLQRIASVAPDSSDQQVGELRKVIGHVNHTIHETRDLARGLSPLYPLHGSLTAALETLTAGAAAPRVTIDIDPRFSDRQVDATAAEHLYRIAAEAVRNARVHGAAHRIEVVLNCAASQLELTVSDDGRGFDTGADGHAGLGMRLMSYRARVIGATCSVESARAGGTRVQISLPLVRAPV